MRSTIWRSGRWLSAAEALKALWLWGSAGAVLLLGHLPAHAQQTEYLPYGFTAIGGGQSSGIVYVGPEGVQVYPVVSPTPTMAPGQLASEVADQVSAQVAAQLAAQQQQEAQQQQQAERQQAAMLAQPYPPFQVECRCVCPPQAASEQAGAARFPESPVPEQPSPAPGAGGISSPEYAR